jgi:hypothetical protein
VITKGEVKGQRNDMTDEREMRLNQRRQNRHARGREAQDPAESAVEQGNPGLC